MLPAMRSLLPLLLCSAAACAGGKGATRGSPPAKVDVECSLVNDGATCTFKNQGGPGTHCVHVLYGVKKSSSVVSSGEVCSGRLPAAGSRQVAVRFPRRPGDLCEGGLEACQLRVIEEASVDRIAVAWQREMTASRQASPEVCAQLARHVFDVYVSAQLEGIDEDAREAAKQEFDSEWESVRPELEDTCKTTMTPEAAACALAATTTEEIDTCAASSS